MEEEDESRVDDEWGEKGNGSRVEGSFSEEEGTTPLSAVIFTISEYYPNHFCRIIPWTSADSQNPEY